MPTVVREGKFSFIIHTRELPFEPPHVHVAFGGERKKLRRAWDEIHDPAEEEEGQS